MHRRRKGRRLLLRIGVASVAIVAAGAGGALLMMDDQGGFGAKRSARAEAPPPVRIDCARSGKVAGSGSSAQQNAMKHWIREYQRACRGVEVAYNPVGSGAGVAQFLRGATAFGGTDGALDHDQAKRSGKVCHGGQAIDLPMVGGPIAVGYNLHGVDDLVLDAKTLARIFNSEIKEWDDPALRRLNPGAELPNLPIEAIHRSDGSGTTENFNAYLAGAAPRQWPYPASKAWQAKGGHAAPGSDGVVAGVASTEGAIGYFELSFAASHRLPTVRVDTGAPEPVAPSPRTASAGIATAEVTGRGKDMTLKFDYGTSATGAYPIVLVTYEIVCDKGDQAETLPALKSFLAYTAGEEGQKILPGIHYAPLPRDVASQVREVVKTLS